jgi:hypothetical protein
MNQLADGGGGVQANYRAREQTWIETFLFLKKVFVHD